MVRKKLVVLTTVTLAASLALAGCGTTSSGSGSSKEAEEAAAEEAAAEEAAEIVEAEEETADIGETVEEEPDEEEASEEEVPEGPVSYNIADLSAKQENMLGPMDTIATCQEEDGPTDYGDAEEVWTAVYLLVMNYSDLFEGRIEYEGNSLYVDEDVLDECASAMFADFDGTLPEGDMGNITKDGDRYSLPGSDRGDSYARISAWTDNPDGTCTVEIQELIESENEITQEYRIELVENEYAGTDEDALFAYSVASVEQTYQKEIDESDEYILPESDSRYYTESELSSLSKEDLRIARNEIYARHGRRFDSEDLQTYFDSKSWYDGTIDPDDFDYNVFNDFETENIRTIESVEAQLESESD